MPSEHAPRVRVVLTVAQQRARVRSLAYGAVVGCVLAVVVVAVAIRADGWVRWAALVVALLPLGVALLAARTATVLRGLRPPRPGVARSREPRARGGGTLPVNLGRAEREAAASTPTVDSAPPSDGV